MTEYKKEAPNSINNARKVPGDIGEYLVYDEFSGKFICKKSYHKKIIPSMEVGYVNSLGYIEVAFKGKRYLGHRVAWFLYYNKHAEKVIDHINGDRKDNRIVNLRDVSQRQNTVYGLKKKGLVGVRYKPRINKWEARITSDKKSIYLGVFPTEIKAYEAYTNKLKQIEAWDSLPDDSIAQEACLHCAELQAKIEELERRLRDLVPDEKSKIDQNKCCHCHCYSEYGLECHHCGWKGM